MDYRSAAGTSVEKIFQDLTTSIAGLGENEARERLAKWGANQIKFQPVTAWQILVRQLSSPFIYLLIAAVFLTLVLGERLDSLMITLFIVINTTIGFVQEYRSEKSLQLLQKYIQESARVRRQGEVVLVNKVSLVKGDILILETGDIIPADVRLIEAEDLTVDESTLTGEPYATAKITSEIGKVRNVYQAKNICFAGTTVTHGKARGVIFATGKETLFGEISKLTLATERVGVFEKEIKKISRFILRMVLLTLTVVVIGNLIIKGGRVGPLELIVFAVALAVSVVPEALPVVITFSLTKGALKLAENKVVVRRLTAIEDLGSIEILATDKTGTLTENQLAVEEINSADPEKTILYAALAASPEHSRMKSDFDFAILAVEKNKAALSGYRVISQIPFNPQTRMNETHLTVAGRKEIVFRGAPEEILKLVALTNKQKQNLGDWVSQKGRAGLRSLALAVKRDGKTSFLGLISFTDPIKATAQRAVNDAEKLGVKIKILTGDGKEVAGQVAAKIGIIKDAGEVISGDEFEALSTEEQHGAVEKYSVFARVTPQQKYHLVSLLQEKYEVGFLGEGINDAPALKIANVAMVVNSAADIARESSDIILLRKSLEVIVGGIKEGRIVFANTSKYIKATLASNLGNFYAVATASFLIDFLPMLPVQILLVNLLSDFPMISVATDNVDSREVEKPERYKIKDIALVALVLGLVSTFFDFIFFAFFRSSPAILQTTWFIGSILTELVFIFSIRTRQFFLRAKAPSGLLTALTLIAGLITIIIPQTRFGEEVFKLISLPSGTIALILLIVCLYFAATEAVKLIFYKVYRR